MSTTACENRIAMRAQAEKHLSMTDTPSIQLVRIDQTWLEIARDWILQTIAVTAAVLFGAWGILSWQEARQANLQAAQANTVAFAALCAQMGPNNAVSYNVIAVLYSGRELHR